MLFKDTACQRWALACCAVFTVAACQSGAATSTAFPMAEVARFEQPLPAQPVLGLAYLHGHEVLPQAAVPKAQPLPAAVPLPHAPVLHDLLREGVAQSEDVQRVVQQALSVQGTGWAGQLAL